MIYLGGGILGNLLSMGVAMKTGSYAVSVGASGAIFAVVGALVFLAVKNRNRISREENRRLMIMAALSLIEGFTQTGTDSMAHLGGFLGGMALCLLLTAICGKQ